MEKTYDEYKGKTIESVTESEKRDGYCTILLILFTDGMSMKIEAGEHLHQIPPFTSTHTGHLVVDH